MRRGLTALLAIGVLSVTARDAAAQGNGNGNGNGNAAAASEADMAAYGALVSTPVGALAPLMITPGAKVEKSFNAVTGRYSHFSSDAGNANSFGASFYHRAGMNAAVSGTLGYATAADCVADCGTLLVGADVHSTLWNSKPNNKSRGTAATKSVNLQGSLGYGSGTDVKYMSFAVGVPLSFSMPRTSGARVSAFVTPGFGWGKVSQTGAAAESGTRPMIGAGAAWLARGGWGLHASFNKVIVDGGGNAFGLGYSWKM
jgi:hypothetical protein